MFKLGRKTRRNSSLSDFEFQHQEFAEKLLDLELKLEESCDQSTIDEIIKLYTSAIDYYESINDQKSSSYHKKLQGFLARKDVKDAIKSPNAPRLNRHEQPPRRTRMLSKHTSSLPDLHLHAIENVMKEHECGTNNAHHLLQDNLKKQEDLFESKIQERQQRVKSHTLSHKENLAIMGRTSDKQIDRINQMFEDEKSKRIKEVRSLYSGQIDEMRSIANCDILKQVVVEMEKSMEREIANVTAKLANEKYIEIDKLRRSRGVTIS
ncbi:unnamed protein product [Blepharisma stoltei]|uniref:Uncharacterized protein n=1 Tax=Blepharisma stoltei TaxID=1481888 RepID=A0AAU9JPT5_9CILI|nr:unnamed protein product [Blepharisma stoltei]